MTAKRVVILATAAIFVILVVSGIYYFVLPPGASTTVTIVATGGPQEGSVAFAAFRIIVSHLLSPFTSNEVVSLPPLVSHQMDLDKLFYQTQIRHYL